MPEEWIDPELFLEYEDVAVYHCYDDDNMVSTYWYTIDDSDCNIDAPVTEGSRFDVRDLPDLGLNTDDRQNHMAIIRNAIQKGLISGEAVTTDAAAADPCQVDESETPDLDTLIEWVDEGICEATDGCVVEPDGTCPHGCQSWLLVLGL
ncbi:MAG: hypothetical protein L0Y56_08550, partial [Nitrospira sp.]|nr:hypothetical protein [Nitrospira sp.]